MMVLGLPYNVSTFASQDQLSALQGREAAHAVQETQLAVLTERLAELQRYERQEGRAAELLQVRRSCCRCGGALTSRVADHVEVQSVPESCRPRARAGLVEGCRPRAGAGAGLAEVQAAGPVHVLC